jgi:hypothetical protein
MMRKYQCLLEGNFLEVSAKELSGGSSNECDEGE